MLVKQARLIEPTDDLNAFQIRLVYAQILAIAEMAPEAIEMLEPLFLPPSGTSVHTVNLDPAFDGIRNDPEFLAMMERYR